jgi:hypothetical protein
LSATIAGFMALFPHSLLVVECASIFAIFTGQVWNMTFGFYHSQRVGCAHGGEPSPGNDLVVAPRPRKQPQKHLHGHAQHRRGRGDGYRICVLFPNPGRLGCVVENQLPYPRDWRDPDFKSWFF